MARFAFAVAFLFVFGASAREEEVELNARGDGIVHSAVRKHSSFAQGSLVRSEVDGAPTILGVEDKIQGAMDGGVALGACKNFKKTATQMSSVSCPAPLKMVGCSCRDKEGEKTGACGTKFNTMETCSVFTKMNSNITAYVRCCHMDWASNFSIKTSLKSDPEEGKGIEIGCDIGETLLGCACLPDDAPNTGCKHNQVKETKGVASCLATNIKDHAAGVKSQALCAVIPNSSSWETVALTVHAVDAATNLSCSKKELQMISCSCGSSIGQCNGGKVVGGKCECNGARCFATARCADIPVPPSDCQWAVWGEWADCSVSCGNGTTSRVREMAVLAMNGGKDCIGATNATARCKGGATNRECNSTRTVPVHNPPQGHTLLIVLVVVVAILTGAGVMIVNANQKQSKMMEGHEGEHHGEYDQWGGQESWGEHQGEHQGEQQWAGPQ